MYLYTTFSLATGSTTLSMHSSITRHGESATPSSMLGSRPSARVSVKTVWIVDWAFGIVYPCHPLVVQGHSALTVAKWVIVRLSIETSSGLGHQKIDMTSSRGYTPSDLC